MEEYLPGSSPLAAVYAEEPGDVGMHLLVAPPSSGPEAGYTTAVMDAVLDRIFARPDVERVVVEPDARNTRIHALNERLGFQPAGLVTLPDKEALLSFCTRADYLTARAALNLPPPSPREPHCDHPPRSCTHRRIPGRRSPAPGRRPLGHRQPAPAPQGARRVLARTHPLAGTRRRAATGWSATTAAPNTASPPGCWNWTTGPSTRGSIRGFRDGKEAPLDVLDFITAFHGTLGINTAMLPVYLEEISSTLASHAYKQWAGQPAAAELAAGVTGGLDAAADFQAIERSMTEGHPCFVANNGRLGFGIGDYLAFAPETGAPVQLVWVAAARSHAVFTRQPGPGLPRPPGR